ncbi:MAG: stalk domain-containing protein, partial [Syntrophomonas sp.]
MKRTITKTIALLICFLLVGASNASALPANTPYHDQQQVQKAIGTCMQNAKNRIAHMKISACPTLTFYDFEKYRDASGRTKVNTTLAAQVLDEKTDAKFLEPGTYKTEMIQIDQPTVIIRELDGSGGRYNSKPQVALLHEFTHAVEYQNGDTLQPGAGKGEWDERNVDWMEQSMQLVENELYDFETAVLKNDGSYSDQKILWTKFVNKMHDLPNYGAQYHHPIPADPAQLMDWFGFRVDLCDIEAYYRSGQAGPLFVQFFNDLENTAPSQGKSETIMYDGFTPGHAWSTITVKIDGVSDLKSEKHQGWRISGNEFTCNANAAQPLKISGTIQAISGISYDDFTTLILIGKGYAEKPTISVNGGSVNFSYTYVPAQNPDATGCQVYVECKGGNPESFAYYVKGDINIIPASTPNNNSSTTNSSGSTSTPNNSSSAANSSGSTDPYHPNVFINGIQQFFDVPAQVVDGRTLVPLSGIFKAFGAQFSWDPATQSITALRGSDVIKLTVGSSQAYVNGLSTILDVPAQVVNGRTLVPLSFIAKSLGAQISYDANTNSVNITKSLDTSDKSGTPSTGTPSNNTPSNNTASTGTPSNNTPSNNTPSNNTALKNTPSYNPNETILFKLQSASGVMSNPPNKTTFALSSESTITKLWTYHYNNGKGATAGTIGLRNLDTNEIIGTWTVIGNNVSFDSSPGAAWPLSSSSEPHIYWGIEPNVTVPAGTYEVVDSSPATWSFNADMGNMGCAWVFGVANNTPPTPPTPPKNTIETILFKLQSVYGVMSNPPVQTTFTLSSETTITKLWTYHYNDGKGATAGTIGLRNVATNEIIGTWTVIGNKISFDSSPGAVWPVSSSSEPHLYWGVQPNVTVPAGTYEVIDSSPATWSYNADMGNMGCTWVFGI